MMNEKQYKDQRQRHLVRGIFLGMTLCAFVLGVAAIVKGDIVGAAACAISVICGTAACFFWSDYGAIRPWEDFKE